MTLQTLAGAEFPTPIGSGVDSVSALLLDADGEKIGMIFQAPKTGNIHKIYFRTGTVTTGDDLTVTMQNVDLADGDPDEVADETASVVTVGDGDDDVWKTADFSVATGSNDVRAVTMGDLMSVVIEFEDFALSGSININTANIVHVNNVYCSHKTGGTWAKARGPLIVVEYDDASYAYIIGVAAGVPSQVTFNTGSSPDEVGNLFQVPWPMRVIGAKFQGRLTADVDLVLYSGAAGASVAERTLSFDANVILSASDSEHGGLFSSAFELAANTDYRIVFKPTTGSSARVVAFTVDDIAANIDWLDQMAGGENVVGTARVDGGTWDDGFAHTDRVYALSLILDQFDDGAGGAASMLWQVGTSGGANG